MQRTKLLVQSRTAGIGMNALRVGVEPHDLATDFKPVSRLLTTFYYPLTSSIYRRFSRQSKLRLAWYEDVSALLPLIFLGSYRA